MKTPWGEKPFFECGMCLSLIWDYLIGYCVLYGNSVLDGCDDCHLHYQMNYTNHWGFQKMEVSNLEEKKILKFNILTIPSSRESTFFINFNWN